MTDRVRDVSNGGHHGSGGNANSMPLGLGGSGDGDYKGIASVG